VGVDLNRNYAFAFNKLSDRFGVETYFDHPCKQTYQGPYAFSESETRAIRDFIFAHIPQLKFVYNWHAQGNEYLFPFNALKVNSLKEMYP
jgi:hypothetical protein